MTTPGPQPDASQLDAYLDGTLSREQRADFEQALARDPQLRRQVEQQRRIDASLRRTMAPPPWSSPLDLSQPPPQSDPVDPEANPTAAPAPVGPYRITRIWRMAASIVLVASIVSVALLYVLTERQPTNLQPLTSMADTYQQFIDRGFEPAWVCETDAEFAETFDYQLGAPLVLGALPANVQALGLSYRYVLSQKTICLLAMVDGQPVVVFAEPADAKQPGPTPPGLHRFERSIANIQLYELTPLPQPALLPAFKLFTPAEADPTPAPADDDADADGDVDADADAETDAGDAAASPAPDA